MGVCAGSSPSEMIGRRGMIGSMRRRTPTRSDGGVMSGRTWPSRLRVVDEIAERAKYLREVLGLDGAGALERRHAERRAPSAPPRDAGPR